jgi:hypothetical protein
MLRTRMPTCATALCLALFAAALGPLFAVDASASVSIAVTWDGLLRESTTAAVVTAVEYRAVWENGRIYTYTHVRVDRAFVGNLATGGDAWVRTMGGVVDRVGQLVEGEAVLADGRPSLLFLHPGPVGAFEVTARGQGQLAIVADDPKLPARVRCNHAVGMLMSPRIAASAAAAPALAADVLDGRSVDDVARYVVAAWSATHAR